NLNDYGDLNELLNYLKVNKLNLLEERIVQHNRLQSLHPMSVNSIRVITNVVNNKVEILGACLKIGVNRVVDNRGVVAPIDVETGIVCGPARSNEFIYKMYYSHPTTNQKIISLEIPYWTEVL